MAMHFPNLPDRVAEIRGLIAAAAARGGSGQSVRVIAVTKTHGPEAAIEAWEAGVPDCGENRVQEALGKMDAVGVPVLWHLIGHLQRNKVHELEHFALLHSLDSSRLADAICEFGVRRGRAVDALVQVNTSGEAAKGGFSPEELRAESDRLASMAGIRVVGAMTMAPLDASEIVLRKTFAGARHARQVLADAGHPATELSMGMSNDYQIAVEEGATMV
ncbi:MAG: YggS family pyridoxal phosphate-dependent enzyme, partial [Gemmatimonadota bacterium]|nr:YggS family pyridoxal phosphate-dependent enzyme [Gemmatimonadota bacterium]